MAIFTNQATLSYNNTVTVSNITTGELLEVLSADKTAVVDTYSSGGTLTYAVSIVNAGSCDMTDLTLTDDLGAYAFGDETLYPLSYTEDSIKYFVNGVLQPAPTVAQTCPLTVTGLNVPANGSVIIIYEAAVTQYAPLGDGETIVNTVDIDSAEQTALTATETVTYACEPELSICKSISPSTVTENSRVTYSFDIINTGAADADSNADTVLSDTFSPILSSITVTMNGTALSETSDYTYDQTTGQFATVPGVITVPAATFTQDAASGVWSVDPGRTTVTISGTI